MNIQIKSMLGGGGLPPYTYYLPVTTNDASTVSSSSTSNDSSSNSSSTKGLLTDKDLFDMIKGINGLPSDVTNILSSIQSLVSTPMSGGALSTSNLATKYLQALNQIKIAEFNKKEYENAYTEVTKNDGLHEIAITERGQVVAQDIDTGKIKSISIDTYKKDNKKYALLTNSQLLSMRAHRYAMDNSLLDVVSNGVGLPTINKYIRDLISKIGTDEVTIEGYNKNISGLVREGIKYILSVLSLGGNIAGEFIDGLYKTSLTTKTSDKQARLALLWIYSTLPQNMRTLLEFKAGSRENVPKLIASLIASDLGSTHTTNVDLLEDASGNKPGSETSEKTKASTNPVLNILNGLGGTTTTFKLNKGTQAELSTDGTTYYSIIDKSGKTIEDTTVADMLAKSGLQSIMDKTSISFGNLLISSDNVQNIIYRNNGGTRVILPCIKENGKVKPRFDILDKFNDVISKVNEQCTEDTPAIQRMRLTAELLKLAGLDELLTSDGSCDTNKVCAFFVIDGYATSRGFKKSENNDMLEETEDPNALDYVEKVLSPDSKHSYKIDRFSWYNPLDYIDYEKVYKGTVYIPIRSNNKLQAITGYGDSINYSAGLREEEKAQRFLRLLNVKQINANVL